MLTSQALKLSKKHAIIITKPISPTWPYEIAYRAALFASACPHPHPVSRKVSFLLLLSRLITGRGY